MADFKIKTDALQNAQSSLENIQGTLRRYEGEIRSVAAGLNFKIAASGSMRTKINKIAGNVNVCSANSKSMSSAAEKIYECYAATENAVKDIKNGTLFDRIMDAVGDFFNNNPNGFHIPVGFENFRERLRDFIKKLPKNGATITYPEYQGLAGIIKGWYNKLDGDKRDLLAFITGTGALTSLLTAGSTSSLYSVEGEIGNKFFNLKGKADVLQAKQTGKIGSNIDWKEGDVNAYAEWNGEVHAATGSISSNWGFGHGKIEGEVGNVAAEGSLNATLFENGELSPRISGKVKVSGSVASGSAEFQNGTDDFNQHASASGKVLSAEASAEATVGKIVSTDSNGNQVVSYGVKAEAGAEAYAAEGEISGGFTFLGIKFDMSLGGKVGGAGVKAGAQVTTGGFEGSIGAGLGVGADVKLKIDWSGFKWPWEK